MRNFALSTKGNPVLTALIDLLIHTYTHVHYLFNFLKFYNDHEFNELNEFSMQDVMMHLRCNEFHELASAGKKSLAISFVKFV